LIICSFSTAQTDLSDVTKLEKLIIIDSHLSGTIPESICNFQNLESVDLHLNCLLPPYPSRLSTADIGNQIDCD